MRLADRASSPCSSANRAGCQSFLVSLSWTKAPSLAHAPLPRGAGPAPSRHCNCQIAERGCMRSTTRRFYRFMRPTTDAAAGPSDTAALRSPNWPELLVPAGRGLHLRLRLAKFRHGAIILELLSACRERLALRNDNWGGSSLGQGIALTIRTY